MEREPLQIPTTRSERLVGSLLRPETDGLAPLIIVLHGWNSRSERYVERVEPLVERGYACLLFDLRGHGETGYDLHDYAPRDHLDDAIAVYDFAVALPGVDASDISAFGSSYGGYLALLLSAERSISRLALVAPADFPDEEFGTPLLPLFEQGPDRGHRYRAEHHALDSTRALRALARFDGDVFIAQAGQDDSVGAPTVEDYLSVARGTVEHLFLSDAEHNFRNGDANERLIAALAGWFAR